jgi:hypothetical protein
LENPTADDLNKFSDIMDKHQHEKILVHCGRITRHRLRAYIDSTVWAGGKPIQVYENMEPAEYCLEKQ